MQTLLDHPESEIRTDADPDGFEELDIALLEVADPGLLVTMTDDNCGQTCAKTTCITGS